MKFLELVAKVARMAELPSTQRRDPELTIRVHRPGSLGPTPSVEVEDIYAGFDWDAGQVMIYPKHPLTMLTPEQVTAIEESVRKGQSWHAYEAYKKHKADMENAALEYAKIALQRDELLAALEGLFQIGQVFASAIEASDHETDFERWAVSAREAIARAKGGAA